MEETNDHQILPANDGEPTPHDFEAAFGEALVNTLDLDTWSAGENLPDLYSRLEAEIRQAVEDEDRIRQTIRRVVFGRIETAPNAAPGAGFYQANERLIEEVHQGLLFNGGVEACDGTNVVHDTVPLTIAQIGVCLVSYHGQQGAWVHRLFRRDLRQRGQDPVQEALDLLDRRGGRAAVGIDSPRDQLSELARRGIMAYAERAILLEKSTAPWRLGHGHPLPYEILTGFWAHDPTLVATGLGMMRRLVEHERFVFVPSAGRKDLMTLGNALHPLEYLVLFTIEDQLRGMLDAGGYRGAARRMVEDFAAEVGPKVVVGLYRASEAAPPQVFYAHRNHARTAALIAMADSTLQWHRGFPMLIDLADNVCRATFDVPGFMASVQMAYSDSGQPTRYLPERETRR